jgi:ribosome-associated toxin RatA of RatAB toxin-antitoxin module
MRTVRRSALVPYTAPQMYELVKDVEAYPSFLPWCNDAEVHLREPHVIEASLELHHRGGGPFRVLSGAWQFQALGDAGSKVSLELEFEFESRTTDIIFGRFFEKICNALVDSFTQRAAQIYATRGSSG